MLLTFLGKGSAYNPLYKNTAAYFTIADKLFIIDCGETVFESFITENFDFSVYSDISIIITHFHSDHVGSLSTLLSYLFAHGHKCNVIHPNSDICRLLEMVDIPDSQYNYCSNVPSHLSRFLTLTTVPVTHSETLPCFGYIIQTADAQFYYSGDSNSIPSDIIERFRNGDCTYIFQDTTNLEQKETSHCSLEYLCELFTPEERKHIFCMHLGSNFDKTITENGFNIVQPGVAIELLSL